ncbi:sugar phosphate isomerase/epimerase [Rhizobium leguminosarum]|nr:sugar phosphate isomerase/epimerase [Rhizobium leguminosarum]
MENLGQVGEKEQQAPQLWQSKSINDVMARSYHVARQEQSLRLCAERATRRHGIDYVKWAIDCSDALGATMLSGPRHSTLGKFSGSGPSAAELKRSVSSQHAIGDHAAKHGVTIGLEALNRFECYLFKTMDDLAAHIDAVGNPHIRAMYDTFHSKIEETDPIGVHAKQ